MVEWLKTLVVGEGNVARERAYTNWNSVETEVPVAKQDKPAAATQPASTPGNKPQNPQEKPGK